MNYMLLVYMEENPLEVPEGCGTMVDRLAEEGNFVAGGILQPTTTATSVRRREGKRLVTDGPFAETREQLAGYMIVEADNLDEAIAIAAEHPVAEVGTIEVRPLFYVPKPVVRLPNHETA